MSWPHKVVNHCVSTLRALVLHRHAVRIVVLGHQKSGTTVIAALLSMMLDDEYSKDPLYFVDLGNAQQVERLLMRPDLLRSVVSRHRRLFCRSVLKDPDLSFLVPQARAVFDNAKFLFVIRDPRTVIRSIADRLSLSKEDLCVTAENLSLPNRHWTLILSGALPPERGATVAEVLAHRWRRAAGEYLQNPGGFTLIKYEDFLQEKLETLRTGLTELGLRQKVDVAQWVDHQFQPKGKSTVATHERIGRGTWDSVTDICRRELIHFGYESVS